MACLESLAVLAVHRDCVHALCCGTGTVTACTKHTLHVCRACRCMLLLVLTLLVSCMCVVSAGHQQHAALHVCAAPEAQQLGAQAC
jgi:hypothetical protein